MKKIAFIPLDNRPVCYDLPIDIIGCSDDFEIFLPPFSSVGALFSVADYDEIMHWFKNLENIDYVVCALDTVAYGSLVASRRCNLSFDEVKKRINIFKKLLIEKNAKTFAFSSIMRISNNNVNEEEKEYWDRYGKKIFDYSFNYHKSLIERDSDANDKFSCISNVIPKEILEDYLATRERNFAINKIYLDWAKEGVVEKLVFSKDDCAQFGLNVMEAIELEQIIKRENINALVKTGADEIPLSLLSGIICQGRRVKIFPVYTAPDFVNLISKYEDIPLEKSVKSQIELAGCEVCKSLENADLIMYVNNFEKEQGELVMNVDTMPFNGEVQIFKLPFFVCDVRYANGADNAFVEKFIHTFENKDKFYGYAGWNTSANTIGSAICAALIKFCAKNFNNEKFKYLQCIRFLDDWAYQANVRSEIRENQNNLNNNVISEKMANFEKRIIDFLKYEDNKSFKYSYPWNRFFEIRINIESKL